MLDPTMYLDPEHDTVVDGDFKPRWYVVRIVANNSRKVVALFDEEYSDEAVRYVAADPDNLKLISAE